MNRRWLRGLRRAAVSAALLMTALFCFLLTPQQGHAFIFAGPSAGCTASVNGQTADQAYQTANAIHVKEHTAVSVTMHMSTPVHRRVIQLSFGLGPPFTVSDETDPSSETTTVAVDNYSTYGVGLYSVDAVATSISGDRCEVLTYVQVEGNPLATVAGGGAAGLEALSLLGIAASALGGANPGDAGGDPGGEPGNGGDDVFDSEGFPRDPLTAPTPEIAFDRAVEGLSMFGFCILATLPALFLTSAAMIGGAIPGGGGPGGTAHRLPRVHWRPYFSVVGMLSGIVGAVAAIVLLQQTSTFFPSYELLGRALVAGLVAGILIPSLTRLIAVRRANRRIAARELAMARRYPAPPPSPIA